MEFLKYFLKNVTHCDCVLILV